MFAWLAETTAALVFMLVGPFILWIDFHRIIFGTCCASARTMALLISACIFAEAAIIYRCHPMTQVLLGDRGGGGGGGTGNSSVAVSAAWSLQTIQVHIQLQHTWSSILHAWVQILTLVLINACITMMKIIDMALRLMVMTPFSSMLYLSSICWCLYYWSS